MKLNGLEKQFETMSSEIVDFNQKDIMDRTPLMYTLANNKTDNLNLSPEQLTYIIKKSDLKQVDTHNWSSLMYALRFNQQQNLNLNESQWDDLIHKSNLKQINKGGWSALIYALKYKENLNLTNEQWKYMIDNSDLSLLNEKYLIELKKIHSELLNDEILNKIEIKAKINKKVKI